LTSEQPSLEEFEETDTGLGNEEWEEVVFSDVISINDYPSAEKGEEYRSVGMSDVARDQRKIDDWEYKEYSYSRPRFRNGQTLMARITPCLENGKTAFVDILEDDEVAVGSTEFIVLSGTDRTLPKFVYYTVRSPEIRQFAIKRMTGTSGRQRVPLDIFHNKKVSLPPIDEQKKIVNILDAIDSKIEINNRINEILQEMAQAIFRSWFIDYEPFSDQEFEYHEGIGEEIPQDWDIKQMSQIARTVDCLHTKKPDKQDEGRFYIEVNDIGESGELQLDDKYLISEEEYKEWTRRITAKEGDVIISKTGRVGAVAQIPEGIEGAIGRNIVCIRPATEELSPAFLKEYMISPLMREEIGRKTLSGTVLESLHVKEIENLRVVVPHKDVRERFEETVGHLHTRINHNIKENGNLKQIRDTLLPKLMSGEIRVNDIELDESDDDSEV